MIFLTGVGQFAHQRRDGQDLVARGQLRVLQQVNHLDLVAARQMRLAESS